MVRTSSVDWVSPRVSFILVIIVVFILSFLLSHLFTVVWIAPAKFSPSALIGARLKTYGAEGGGTAGFSGGPGRSSGLWLWPWPVGFSFFSLATGFSCAGGTGGLAGSLISGLLTRGSGGW